MILGTGEIPKLILLSYDLGSMKQRRESTFIQLFMLYITCKKFKKINFDDMYEMCVLNFFINLINAKTINKEYSSSEILIRYTCAYPRAHVILLYYLWFELIRELT